MVRLVQIMLRQGVYGARRKSRNPNKERENQQAAPYMREG